MSIFALNASDGTIFYNSVDASESKQPVTFRDCFGRAINVGDVLACGQRQGSHGGISIGVVRGFTKKSVLVDIIDKIVDYSRDYEDWEDRYFTTWNPRKGHFNAPQKCCTTGLTEASLRALLSTETEESHETQQ